MQRTMLGIPHQNRIDGIVFRIKEISDYQTFNSVGAYGTGL